MNMNKYMFKNILKIMFMFIWRMGLGRTMGQVRSIFPTTILGPGLAGLGP